MKTLNIAVGVLKSADRVLIALRQKGQDHADHWEFPGGKIEADETPIEALQREFNEEIGVETNLWQPLIDIPWAYEHLRVNLKVFVTESFEGEVFGQEGQEIRWVTIHELQEYTFPAANKGMVTALQMANQLMVTGEMQDAADGLHRLQAALEEGVRLVSLKPKTLEAEDFLAFAREAVALAHKAGAKVLLNGKPEWLEQVPEADGVQLSSSTLMTYSHRPIPENKWLVVSGHDLTDVAKAVELQAEAMLLSPIQATAAHPELTPLGWQGFADWVSSVSMPVFAYGGLKPGDEKAAVQHGGQGIALTRGLWPDPL